MARSFKRALIGFVVALLAYLLLWPVPVDPFAWTSTPSEGYVDAYAPNELLANLERHDVLGRHGPEDAAIGADGALYITTGDGDIFAARRMVK